MNTDEWNEYDKIYQDVMSDAKEQIKDKVKENNSGEKTKNTRASVITHALVHGHRNEKDHKNTVAANKARANKLDDKINNEEQEWLSKFSKEVEREIYEDFGGSRQAAKELHQQYLEQEKKKLALKDKSKDAFKKEANKESVQQHFNSKKEDAKHNNELTTDASKEAKTRIKEKHNPLNTRFSNVAESKIDYSKDENVRTIEDLQKDKNLSSVIKNAKENRQASNDNKERLSLKDIVARARAQRTKENKTSEKSLPKGGFPQSKTKDVSSPSPSKGKGEGMDMGD